MIIQVSAYNGCLCTTVLAIEILDFIAIGARNQWWAMYNWTDCLMSLLWSPDSSYCRSIRIMTHDNHKDHPQSPNHHILFFNCHPSCFITVSMCVITIIIDCTVLDSNAVAVCISSGTDWHDFVFAWLSCIILSVHCSPTQQPSHNQCYAHQ